MGTVRKSNNNKLPLNELGDNGQLVQLLLESTGEGIYGADLDGNCTLANPACLDLLGYESDGDLLGKNMHALVHHTRPNGENYPVEDCRIYRAFREHEGVHVDEEVMWRSDGVSFPAEYWSYPVERDAAVFPRHLPSAQNTVLSENSIVLRRHDLRRRCLSPRTRTTVGLRVLGRSH